MCGERGVTPHLQNITRNGVRASFLLRVYRALGRGTEEPRSGVDPL